MRVSSVAVVACALALLANGARAGEGDLDPGFTPAGKIRIALDDPSGSKADHPTDLLLQPDGMVLVLGSVATQVQDNLGLARIRPNGLPDPLFNADGNSDGEIVFGTFNTLSPRGLALQPDGRIVVAARYIDGQAVLLRRAANGDDASFPGASLGLLPFAIPGATSTEFADLVGLSNGQFLAAGTFTTVAGAADFFVARFNADGTLDTSFGTQPGYTRIAFDLDLAEQDRAAALARASDGRIAVVGTVSESDNEFGIAMLQANGMPDMGFDGDGKAVVNFDIGITSNDRATAACFAPNGNLMVVGTVSDSVDVNVAGLALLSTTGSLVNGFNGTGRLRFGVLDTTDAADVACAADGKFVMTGTFETSDSTQAPSEAYVVRFLANGSTDNAYGTFNGTTPIGLNRPTQPPPTGRADLGVAIALRADGAVYATFDSEFAAPDYDFGLARLSGSVMFSDGFE